RQIEIVCRIGKMDRRKKHGSALVRDQLAQVGIAIIRCGLELAAEGRLRIGKQHRNERLALQAHQKRLVVRQKLREQRHHEQNKENPEGRVAASVRLEV